MSFEREGFDDFGNLVRRLRFDNVGVMDRFGTLSISVLEPRRFMDARLVDKLSSRLPLPSELFLALPRS